MKVRFESKRPTTEAALAVLSGKDVKAGSAAAQADQMTGGQVGRALSAARFDGEAGALVELIAPTGLNATRLLVAGVGPEDKISTGVFERIGGALIARLQASGEKTLVIDVTGAPTGTLAPADAGIRIAYGALLRSWRHDVYRTKQPEKSKPTLEELVVVGAGADAAARFEAMRAVAEGVFLARELVTEPANIVYPEAFVERCQGLAELGVEIRVLGEDEMRKLGMGALLGVSQGSIRPARLLAMRWDGTGGAAEKPVALIGKGVTFDTGGISIKPAAGMEDMKWDMGGAAAVAGAIKALATRKAKAHVVGICGLVENMPGGEAQRPGDVVTSMSGQTIEVINTDAEGRLVLCDAITWAQREFKPEVIVDLATLTGAMIITLGHEYAGLFANDDGLAEQLRMAGEATGDKLWRMPMGESYDKLLESPIADMKNVGPRYGGSITAAQFIKRFVDEGVKWAHLDIAGMVWAAKPGPVWDKGATGYGVRLLDRFIFENYERG